ncbi:hypothetical protein SAMN05444166_0188 [Singulisphaera sp. GP187]|nr:hypothetical protein SAMN05444166_0188 [Singulisphaera sp. GP187]
MHAERRIGKTSVLRKMKHDPAQGGEFPVLLELERFHSAEEFAIAVYEPVQAYLKRKKGVRMRSLSSAVLSESEQDHWLGCVVV